MSVVVVAVGVCVLGGIGFVLVHMAGGIDARPGFERCTAPPREAQVIGDYARDPALRIPPKAENTPATPMMLYPQRYCDNVGVDATRWAMVTAERATYQTSGFFPSARLRSRYEPVARAGGWSYVRQGDEDQAGSCFWVEHAGTRYCQGNGVEYCKLVDGVVTFLLISGESRKDIPDFRAFLDVDLEAQWDLTACPPSTPPAPVPTRTVSS
jgi:uncharacterized cupin superfamily protein